MKRDENKKYFNFLKINMIYILIIYLTDIQEIKVNK